MKIITILFSIFILFGPHTLLPSATYSNAVYAENGPPSYAKWSKLALQHTKERYPDANIIDYLHIGKEDGEQISTEKFKLWLEKSDKKFFVLVDIKFSNTTEELINITFREVNE